MPDPGHFCLFIAAALVLALTPGPGIFYVAARTLAGGRAEGIASSVGTGLKLLGAAYLGASGAAMAALGIGLALARRPAT